MEIDGKRSKEMGSVNARIAEVSSSLVSLSRNDTHVSSTAAVERGPPEGARSGSKELTWVLFPHLLLSAGGQSISVWRPQ